MGFQRTSYIFCTPIALILWNIVFICVCYGSLDELSTPEMIQQNGYPVKTYTIYSRDDRILRMHRIPHGKHTTGNSSAIPILLHHGLFSSSKDWVINGPERSLAYKLADAGYDVWMANARGNEYSIVYKPRYRVERSNFWDFSYHEMGIYDLPAFIDHVLETTGYEQLIYVGHSTGTTSFFVLTSEKPEYNKKIKFQISLAPMAALGNTKSAFRLLMPFLQVVQQEEYCQGIYKNSKITRSITRWTYCPNTYYTDTYACAEDLISQLFGSDPEQLDKHMLPTLIRYVFSGTSIRCVLHIAQLIRRGEFSRAEYTEEELRRRWGPPGPPPYDISNIVTPIRIYYGENDLLADPEDTHLLYRQLPKRLGLVKVDYEKFNHIDFIWAKDINPLLNDPIIDFINRASHPQNGDKFIEETIRSNKPSPLSP